MTEFWHLNDDPHAQREADNYSHAIPSREFLLAWLAKQEKALTLLQLAKLLGLKGKKRHEALSKRLQAMVRDEQIHQDEKKRFKVHLATHLITGRVVGHRDGSGFLIRDDQIKPDLVLTTKQMRRVFDSDLVSAKITGVDHRGRLTATIIDILEAGNRNFVGQLVAAEGLEDSFYFQADNPRITQKIIIPKNEAKGAKLEQIVAVSITQPATLRRWAVGQVDEILGQRFDPGIEIQIAVRRFNLPFQFDTAVEQQLEHFSEQVKPQEKKARVDLRDLPLVTIDGEDAKDFDDAVFAELLANQNWRLIVAIADVSYYVEVGSALDQTAFERGNSVYFPGEVIPMLPELLSNGLCSLNPHVDRLSLVCEMQVDQQGNLIQFEFYEALIRSAARLTYTQVADVLENLETVDSQKWPSALTPLVPALKNLQAVFQLLFKARQQRGAIDFDSLETQIVFNAQRKIERIVPRQRNIAHHIIEECMLAANVATALFLEHYQLPGLYRIHQRPSSEKLESLRTFLAALGLTLAGGAEPSPADFQTLREQISTRLDKDIIQTVMLRSMMQAVYSPQNEGHFGLAYPAYAHFTSPIRRYPDLLNHRAIRSVIHGRQAKKFVRRLADTPHQKASFWFPYQIVQMQTMAEHCSMTERRADEATRDVTDWLKCEFMQDKIGDVLLGHIVAVTSFGLFVRLQKYFIEGLVHVTSLPADYYQFEADHYLLRGERSHRIYRLGDQLEVRVARVDLEQRNIDFVLTEKTDSQKIVKNKKQNKKKNDKKATKIVTNPIKGSQSKSTKDPKKTSKGHKKSAQKTAPKRKNKVKKTAQ